MKKITYILEIYSPGQTGGEDEKPCLKEESDMPFMAFNKGDIVTPIFSDYKGKNIKYVLKIISIEHFVFEVDKGGLRHHIVIFTERVPNTTETRLGNSMFIK